MTEVRKNRKLAAILAADVVGYSRLTANNEAGTLAALKRYREGFFDPVVAAHGGRIFKLIGDGTLVEFASVVEAVLCAVEIQTGTQPLLPTGGSIILRIGINPGDVIMDGEDIYGDGVNIAARLEPLAEPGGICVASSAMAAGRRLRNSSKARHAISSVQRLHTRLLREQYQLIISRICPNGVKIGIVFEPQPHVVSKQRNALLQEINRSFYFP